MISAARNRAVCAGPAPVRPLLVTLPGGTDRQLDIVRATARHLRQQPAIRRGQHIEQRTGTGGAATTADDQLVLLYRHLHFPGTVPRRHRVPNWACSLPSISICRHQAAAPAGNACTSPDCTNRAGKRAGTPWLPVPPPVPQALTQ